MSKKSEILGAYERGLDALGSIAAAAGATRVATAAPATKATTAKAPATIATTNRVAPAATTVVTTRPSAVTSAAASAGMTVKATSASPASQLTTRVTNTKPAMSPIMTPAEKLFASSGAAARNAALATTKTAAATSAKAVGAKINSTGQYARTVGKKFAKHHSKGGNKLAALGDRMVRGSTKFKGDDIFGNVDAFMQVAMQANDSLFAFSAMQAAVKTIAAMADLGNQMYAQMQTMNKESTSTAQLDAIKVGNSIVDQMNAVVESYSDDPASENWDWSSQTEDWASVKASADDAARTANNLSSQAQAWLQAASQLAQSAATSASSSPGAFDPGTPGGGGGGGGGGGDDEGAAWPEGDEAAASGGESGRDDWPEGDAALADQGEYVPEPGESATEAFRHGHDPFEESGEYPTDDYAEVTDDAPMSEDEAFWSEESSENQATSEEAGDIFPDDVLGIDFKWQYVLAPWFAAQDQQAEDAARMASATNKSTSAPHAPAKPVNTARLNAAKRRLAQSKARLAAYEAERAREVAANNADAPPIASSDDEILGSEFSMTEEPDIFFAKYEHQITDEPPDPERRRASVHRGAAYLDDIDYPPGGASAGQDGGNMRPEQKIEVFGGNVLDRHQARREVRAEEHAASMMESDDDLEILGEAVAEAAHEVEMEHQLAKAEGGYRKAEVGDIEIFGADSFYQRGLDALAGAALSKPSAKVQARAGFVLRGKNSMPAMVVNKVKQGDHKTSIANAKDMGKRAVSVGNKLLNSLKKIPKTKIRGAVMIKKPAKAAAAAAKSRKPMMSVAQMQTIAKNAVAAGNKLIKQAGKYENLVKAQNSKAVAGRAAVQKMMMSAAKAKGLATVMKTPGANATSAKMSAATTVTTRASTPSAAASTAARRTASTAMPAASAAASAGRMTRMLGDDPDMVRDIMGAYCDVLADELREEVLGFTGPIDEGGDVDPNTGLPMGTDPSADSYSVDPSTGIPLGTSGSDAMVQQIQSEIAKLGPRPTTPPPPDMSNIAIDPAANDPEKYNSFYNDLPPGGFWFDNVPDPRSGNDQQSAFGSFNRYFRPNHDGFEFTGGKWYKVINGDYNEPSGADYADINASSKARGWGPIIGRPDRPEYRGLRMISNGPEIKLFWFYDQAPQRFKQADDDARLQQAITDWETQNTGLQAQLADAVYQSQVAAEEAIRLQQQQAAEDAQMQRQIEQEQKMNQHQLDMDSAAQSAAEQASYQQQQNQVELEAQQASRESQLEAEAYERASQIAEAEQRRQDERDFELARRLDEAQNAEAEAAIQDQSAVDAYQAAEEGVPAEELPEQYVEAAAEEEGGGAAYDSGNLDEYTDSEYVDEDVDAAAETVMGNWQQGEGGEDAWEHGEGEGWAMDLDDDISSDVIINPLKRIRGAERIRHRRSERR